MKLKKIKHLLFVHIILLGFFQSGYSQDEEIYDNSKRTDIGVIGQVYPAGIILSTNAERFINKKSSILIRLGLNLADRKDYSEYNENEKGNGFGASLGLRKHYKTRKGTFIVGIHSDIWNMWINWKNNLMQADQTQGKSYTFVLQPWVEGGYFINPGKSNFHLGISLGVGREINLITNGEDVGQGWMLSGLAHLQYSIN